VIDPAHGADGRVLLVEAPVGSGRTTGGAARPPRQPAGGRHRRGLRARPHLPARADRATRQHVGRADDLRLSTDESAELVDEVARADLRLPLLARLPLLDADTHALVSPGEARPLDLPLRPQRAMVGPARRDPGALLADAVAYLASDAAPSVAGAVLWVDRGTAC
jgi:hypothetical protein